MGPLGGALPEQLSPWGDGEGCRQVVVLGSSLGRAWCTYREAEAKATNEARKGTSP